MATATLFYLLSEKGRKDSILKGGSGREFQIIETEATPEVLDLADVKPDGSILLPVGCRVDKERGKEWVVSPWALVADYRIGTGLGDEPTIKTISKNTHFDTVQTADQLVAHEKARLARLAMRPQLEAELAPKLEAWKKERAERNAAREARKAEEKAAREARKAAEEAEREKREAEKLAWVREHGTDHLKDAVELGYDCQRLYATERATLEFPDFELDFDGDADWNDRACPSWAALAEVKELVAKGLDAKVVWLTEPVERDEDGYEACEAIAIRDFLGRYDLVKII